MAIDNKDKKVLKSSIEREQNEVACSAECEKIKGSKNLNVPHLRFPEFSGEWKMATFGDIAKGFDYGMNAAAKSFDGNNKYIRITDIDEVSSQYLYDDVVSPDGELEDRYLVKENDILLARTGASTGKSYLYRNSDGKLYFAGFLIRANIYKHNSYFVFSQLHTLRYKKWISVMSARSGQPGINSQEYASFPVYTTSLQEEDKIATFLKLLDERIITQNKIIEKLQSLIKGIAQHCIKESTSGNTYVKLGDICQITTGKLDANAQVDNGIYPFFTCAEQPFKIDSFAFDTEALLISGNGANLGYINYYKGKFNAYQRTYVLDLFSENIQYIKWALKVLLPKRIAIEKSSSNTPYIVLSTLTDLRLPIPCKSKQSFIANLMQSLERKLSNQIAQYDSYNYLKQYLLRQMFI
jgi:type I restriction enzyme S subunit